MTAPPRPELDLDGATPDPSRVARPSWPAAIVVIVVAAVAGAWLHAGLTRTAVTARPRISAGVAVDAVRLADGPTAVLHLVITSHDDATVYLTGLRLTGAGVVEQAQRLWRPLTPGLVENLRLPAELACRGPDRRTPLLLTLTVARDGSAGTAATPPSAAEAGVGETTVTAVAGGAARVPGGLCQAGDQQLPRGYRAPATVRVVAMTGPSLTLALTDLPDDATEIFAAQADGWLLPVLSPTTPIIGRGTTVTLGPPQPQCSDAGTRGVLPTGLQLRYLGNSGVREAYAPIGPSLARWLLTARNRACPMDPPGP